MADSYRSSLRQLLAVGYKDLRQRLARRLGSAELASEALHETWLRLDSGRSDATVIDRPNDYIFRVALNIASDRQRTDQRRLGYSEIEAMYHFADSVIDAEGQIEARSELMALDRAFRQLSPRQRAILTAVRIEGVTHAELARRHGISERMVDKDLRRALEACADQLERILITRFGSRPAKPSIK